MVKLRQLDLNLLIALKALLDERHVSRAGQRIGRTQPAMSNALARLRTVFNDDLLIRTPQGMQLTNRAKELAGPLSAALEQLELAIGGDGNFDPRHARRNFTLAMADYTSLILLPRLKRHLSVKAPGITLSVIPSIRAQGIGLVDRGEADLAIGTLPDPPSHLRSQQLFIDRLACMARKGHPALRAPPKLQDYLSLGHIAVRRVHDPPGAIDLTLERQGLGRRIEVVVPLYLIIPLLLSQTDLVATEPERLAQAFSGAVPLSVQPPPFEGPKIVVSQVWHSRSDRDQGHRWLRDNIAKLISDPGP